MSKCPVSVEPYARDPNLTSGREYEVHAITVYNGLVFMLLVDDLDYPGWKPAWLFKTSDCTIPKDWICNTMPDWPDLLLGPDFIANNREAYASMVELEAPQVEKLRNRIVASQRKSDQS